jgi:hypothetical protein
VVFEKTYADVLPNEIIRFSEPIENMAFDRNHTVAYFVTVEATEDVNPFSGRMMAIAERFVLFGDVDGDGVIDAADITLLRRWIAAENKWLFEQENPRFNIDNARVLGQSGDPGAADVARLRQYIAGFNVPLGEP